MSQRTAASGVTARIQTETIKKVRSNVRCVTIDVHSSLDTVAKAFLHHRLQIFRTLTGDFGDGMEAMSHSDFGSFGLFAGNCPRGISGILQHYRHFETGRRALKSANKGRPEVSDAWPERRD
jgi:hypothetical protein